MIDRAEGAVRKEIVLSDSFVQRSQRLRMKRFGISVATFIVVLLATALISRIGLSYMSGAEWTVFIGVGLLGVLCFFVLFSTSANLHFTEPSLTREQIVFWSLWGLLPMYWMPEVRPIILLFYLPPFSFGILILTLRQYLGVVACILGIYSALLVVEYTQAPQVFDFQYQLFLFALFGILLTWFAVYGGFVSNIRRRLRAEKEILQEARKRLEIEVERRERIQVEKDNLILELQEAIGKVKTLSGYLPICASCKNIRDDKGYWNQIESYIRDHSEAEFSHGICPDCAKKLYPGMDLYPKK